MLAVLEMLEEENKKLIAKGKKQAKLEDAKKMIERGMEIKTIMEITELKKEEIEKLLK